MNTCLSKPSANCAKGAKGTRNKASIRRKPGSVLLYPMSSWFCWIGENISGQSIPTEFLLDTFCDLCVLGGPKGFALTAGSNA